MYSYFDFDMTDVSFEWDEEKERYEHGEDYDE